MMKKFALTGRYSVSAGDGFYNLTIAKVNVSEAGEYICHEALGNGPRSSTQLTVLGKISKVFRIFKLFTENVLMLYSPEA